MNYKQALFQKAIVLEQQMNELKDEKRKKAIREFVNIMDELVVNGWRQEYDMWTQTIRE